MTADSNSSAARPARAGRRPRDMIISLLVLLVPIALIFVGWRLLFNGPEVTGIDPRPSYREAASTGLEVREPSGLGRDWVPVSHAVDRAGSEITLRVGYHSPNAAGIQLVESDRDVEVLVPDELGKTRQQEGVEISGAKWKQYLTIEGNQAFVLTKSDTTVIVHGESDVEELRELAASLK